MIFPLIMRIMVEDSDYVREALKIVGNMLDKLDCPEEDRKDIYKDVILIVGETRGRTSDGKEGINKSSVS